MFSPLVSPKGPKYTTAITTCRKPLSITCRFEIPLQRLLWGSAQNEVSLLKRCPNYPNLNRKQFMSVLFLIFTQQKHLTLSEFQASLYACAIVNLAHIYSQKLGVRFYLWLLRIWMQEYLFSLFQNTIRTSYGSIYVKKMVWKRVTCWWGHICKVCSKLQNCNSDMFEKNKLKECEPWSSGFRSARIGIVIKLLHALSMLCSFPYSIARE